MPRSTTPGVLEMIHAELPHARHAVVIDKPACIPVLKQVEISVFLKEKQNYINKYISISSKYSVVLSALWKNAIFYNTQCFGTLQSDHQICLNSQEFLSFQAIQSLISRCIKPLQLPHTQLITCGNIKCRAVAANKTYHLHFIQNWVGVFWKTQLTQTKNQSSHPNRSINFSIGSIETSWPPGFLLLGHDLNTSFVLFLLLKVLSQGKKTTRKEGGLFLIGEWKNWYESIWCFFCAWGVKKKGTSKIKGLKRNT